MKKAFAQLILLGPQDQSKPPNPREGLRPKAQSAQIDHCLLAYPAFMVWLRESGFIETRRAGHIYAAAHWVDRSFADADQSGIKGRKAPYLPVKSLTLRVFIWMQ